MNISAKEWPSGTKLMWFHCILLQMSKYPLVLEKTPEGHLMRWDIGRYSDILYYDLHKDIFSQYFANVNKQSPPRCKRE